MTKSRALCSVAILGLVATLFGGCGDGDNTSTKLCKPITATCANDEAGQVCNDDGTRLIDFSCSEGEVCQEGACVGQCEPAEQRCASDAAVQVCSEDGKQWVPIPCSPGTACSGDEGCVPTEEGVQVCDPEREPVCATDKVVKACDADGSGWVFTNCASHEHCVDGVCVFDEDSACTPGEAQCVNGASAVCNSDGDGWIVTECDDATPCEDGLCRGPVCVPGTSRCAPVNAQAYFDSYYGGGYDHAVLYTCNDDGTGWIRESCDAGQYCVYDDISDEEVDRWVDQITGWWWGGGAFPEDPGVGKTASCQTPGCPVSAEYGSILNQFNFLGGDELVSSYYGPVSEFCGTLDDPGVGAYLGAFTRCEGLPPFQNLEWVSYECAAHEYCSSYLQQQYHYLQGWGYHYHYSQRAACYSECTPGQVTCASADATITCEDDGNYGAPEQCPLNEEYGYELTCRVTENYAGGTTAACVDPVCAYWLETLGTLTVPDALGACTPSGQFAPCLPDGTLGEPVDCDGICVDEAQSDGLGSASNAAGLNPGYCQHECEEGEQRCIFDENDVASPLYQVCVDNKWSPAIHSCGTDVNCWDGGSLDLEFFDYFQPPMNTVLCGAVCTPGTVVCGGAGGIELLTCNDDGQWDAPKDCPFGACEDHGAFVQCEAECIPGTKSCNGSGTDGPNDSSNIEYVCGEDGRWDAGTPCDDSDPDFSELCRVDRAGVVLGCVQCIGTDTNGNENGLADSECRGIDPYSIRQCNADNEWDDEVACEVDEICLQLGNNAVCTADVPL